VPCRRASTPSSPFLRSSGAVVQHLGDPPAVVHVEGRVGDAGQRPGVRETGVVVGRLLDKPTYVHSYCKLEQ
jgi:hypothetical protein